MQLGSRRQSRSVTFLYGGIAGVLLVVIATIALVVQPPSPPALAEFAPQAEKTIEEAPDQQSSQFGRDGTGACAAGQQDCAEGGTGAGLGGGGGKTPATTAPPAEADEETRTVIDVKRVRRCVGDPPRQTEDPQSPPCVNYWQGDNGGATSPGVTRDEIRVAVSPSTNVLPMEDMQQLADFFNRRYEFYGRKLSLVIAKGIPDDSPEQQRLAADSAAEAKPFAAIGYPQNYGPSSLMPYRTRLADQKIVSVAARDDFAPEARLQSLHPYAWNYTLSYDRLAADMAEFTCQSLADQQAAYGGPGVSTKVRKFAVLRGTVTGASPDPADASAAPVLDGLRACRAPMVYREYTYDTNGANPAVRSMMADLQQQNVTTILVPATILHNTKALMTAASGIGYQPEWLLPGGGVPRHLEDGHSYNQFPADQTSHMMAMGGWNKGNPLADRPSIWAYQEVGLGAPLTGYESEEMEWNYENLLLLASGIQAAGPRLTPETFAKGLQGLKFPNPGAAAAPYYQATVGFAGDHTMVEDEALQWWNPSAPAYRSDAGDTGGWCYIDLGARWHTGHWPKRTYPFFDLTGPCR